MRQVIECQSIGSTGYVVPVVRVSGWSAFFSRVSRIGKVLLVVCAGVKTPVGKSLVADCWLPV